VVELGMTDTAAVINTKEPRMKKGADKLHPLKATPKIGFIPQGSR
jgi:hypothetical protein